MNTAGIVLAGGKSSRFGGEKSLAKIGGIEMVARSVDALAGTGAIIVVARPGLAEKIPRNRPIEVICDLPRYRGKGPLAGIYSAMLAVDAQWYAVLPCDTPWIGKRTVARLLQERDPTYDAIVARAEGRIQPLVAVFHNRVKEKVREQLETGRLSMRALFERCRLKFIDFAQEKAFANINTKEDYILQQKEAGDVDEKTNQSGGGHPQSDGPSACRRKGACADSEQF